MIVELVVHEVADFEASVIGLYVFDTLDGRPRAA
jgi:hypothetical protein